MPSAYDELMRSVDERVKSGAQDRDTEADRKKKREEDERRRKAEEEARRKREENATGDRVKEGLRRWINPDMFKRGGASDELKAPYKGRGSDGVRG